MAHSPCKQRATHPIQSVEHPDAENKKDKSRVVARGAAKCGVAVEEGQGDEDDRLRRGGCADT